MDRRIVEIKYLCACEPVANVAVEVLCDFLKGKTVDEAASLTAEPFYQAIGSQEEKLCGKVRGLLELLNEGLASYQTPAGTQKPVIKDGDGRSEKLTWDGALST